MQKPEQIQKRIDEILSDDRLSYGAADVFTNAPLALIQLSMEVELHALQRVLEVPLTDFNELRKKS